MPGGVALHVRSAGAHVALVAGHAKVLQAVKAFHFHPEARTGERLSFGGPRIVVAIGRSHPHPSFLTQSAP